MVDLVYSILNRYRMKDAGVIRFLYCDVWKSHWQLYFLDKNVKEIKDMGTQTTHTHTHKWCHFSPNQYTRINVSDTTTLIWNAWIRPKLRRNHSWINFGISSMKTPDMTDIHSFLSIIFSHLCFPLLYLPVFLATESSAHVSISHC